MKTKTSITLLLASVILLLNTAVSSADMRVPIASVNDPTSFPAHEGQFDLYGTIRDNWHLGMGVGANYFFTQWLGAGIETRFEEFDWPNQINGNLYARYPMERYRLAPYIYAGGGRQYRDGTQWLAQVGAGVDYRIRPCLGLFGDIRGTFPGKTSDYALFRFGVRFRF